MRLALLCCAALVGGLACDRAASTGQPVSEDSFQDDDIPVGECEDTECPPDGATVGDGATAPVGGPCDGSNHCQSGVCAASFQNSEFGELVCQPQCIGQMDATMWCSDSATCCGNAVCSPRGFCVAGEDESSGGGNMGGDESTGGNGSTSGGSDSGSGTAGDANADGTTG